MRERASGGIIQDKFGGDNRVVGIWRRQTVSYLSVVVRQSDTVKRAERACRWQIIVENVSLGFRDAT